MPTHELLPGVTAKTLPTPIVSDAHAQIRRARRRAMTRDVAQIAILIAVDYMFMRWPDSRMPFLERGGSLMVLRALNVVLIADLWLSRSLPRWMAKRVATTWSRSERERFDRLTLN
jgi:hypothetical protein